ncbi:MAG: cation-translocating P-type ATPase [Eubacteriales bacterium]
MTNTTKHTGLTSQEAKRRQQQYGKNEPVPQKQENFFIKILRIVCEPMFLLLVAAAVIYFLLGEPGDGAVMLIFVIGVIGIDVIQERKTDRTLNALKDLAAPQVTVIRDGKKQQIAGADLVPGDIMLIHEGVKIPADGFVIRCADFCVDESSLTGESAGVWKIPAENADSSVDCRRAGYCFAGTLVIQGSAAVEVDRIGSDTEYGRIGSGIASAPKEYTPLQKQTVKLVKACAVIAVALSVLVGVFTWLSISGRNFGDRLVDSILSGVTLAMAMIPEEFPVILTVFLSMGAWRLAKKHSLVRRLPSVETLGAVSVLCVDKTGTITVNQMTVREIRVVSGTERTLLETMGLGCEMDAYDPMEKAMLRCCKEHGIDSESLFENELAAEYPFTNELKMMGHVWRINGTPVIAAKGSPERILTVCELTEEERAAAGEIVNTLSSEGLRVIAVATGYPETDSDIPDSITDCRLTLLGMVGLADPPRESVKNDIAVCNSAGIRVVMITGDNGVTASAIAGKVGIPVNGGVVTGEMLDAITDDELRNAVRKVSVFSRVIPEHKKRIVKALKENGEIVAMTGDGVNDAPALKHADIGIAMGKRGSEVTREAAYLILTDDNFTTVVETVKDGRRIYDNIRKAVGYVFTIHIPIALSSLLAPFLGIDSAALLLLPIHVVLLEVIIDPTCSVVLERQPAERNIMERGPRDPGESLLTVRLLAKSVLQGLTVFAASFGAYYITLAGNPENAPAARAMGLAIIMLANLFLVQVNSSERDFAVRSVTRLAKDKVMWAVSFGTPALLCLILYTPLSGYLKLAPLSACRFLTALAIAALSVLWYEAVKLVKKLRSAERA